MNKSNAFTEVEVVINNLSKMEYDKIPQEILDTIRNNKDENYTWNYDFDKSLVDQDLSKEAKELLSYIIMNYLLDKKDKEIIEKKFQEKDKLLFEINTEKVLSYDEMFSKKDIIHVDKEENSDKSLSQKEDSIFQKIKRFISKLLKK